VGRVSCPGRAPTPPTTPPLFHSSFVIRNSTMNPAKKWYLSGIRQAAAPKPFIGSIAFMGDSLTAGLDGNETSANHRQTGYMWPLFSGDGNGMQWVRRASTNTNFNVGGYSIAEIRDVLLPEVIVAAPDACFLLCGTNSIGFAINQNPADLSVGADWAWAQIAEILTGLRAAGIRCIIGTITGDRFTIVEGTPTTGQKNIEYRIMRKLMNDRIRANARSYGAVVCDWWHVISTDPTDELAPADAGFLDADTTINPLHFGYQGYWHLGEFALNVIRQNFTFPDNFEIPAEDSPLWYSLNPYLAGDSSGLASSFSIVQSGCTVGSSKLPDGRQRMTCADGPLPGGAGSFYLRTFRTNATDSWDGKRFRAIWDVEFSEEDFAFWSLDNRLSVAAVGLSVERQARMPVGNNATLNSICTQAGPYRRRHLFVTPIVQQPAGGTRQITADLRFLGRGTVDVRVAGIFEVPTP
jgi:lysophospholipase L1-like esterase